MTTWGCFWIGAGIAIAGIVIGNGLEKLGVGLENLGMHIKRGLPGYHIYLDKKQTRTYDWSR